MTELAIRFDVSKTAIRKAIKSGGLMPRHKAIGFQTSGSEGRCDRRPVANLVGVILLLPEERPDVAVDLSLGFDLR